MRKIFLSILILSYSSIFCQNNLENGSEMVNLIEPTYGYDLTEHWYWSGYLKAHGKKSIASDSIIKEGYRLIYWGDYFSIVEIIKKDNSFEIIVDSVSWIENKIYRAFDTIQADLRIFNLRSLGSALASRSKRVNLSIYEVYEDDRDNWAFELKNENFKFAIEGIEVNQEFSEIIDLIMELGDLSGYTIYNQNGGKYKD
jgi:hypothetical protein